MRYDRPVWLALALVVLLGGVRADDKGDKEAAVKEEHKALNGTWEVVRSVVDGKEQPAPKEAATVTLKDGKYTTRAGGKVTGEGTFTVDPATSPRSLDVTPSTGPNKGKTFRAIYEVKGDTHRLCAAQPGKPRPKAFESKEGSGHILVTYERAKRR